VVSGTEGSEPQGLKPASWVVIGGTAEAVPFPVRMRTPVPSRAKSKAAGRACPELVEVSARYTRGPKGKGHIHF